MARVRQEFPKGNQIEMIATVVLAATLAVPETSRLFDRVTDPVSGVVSYVLRPGTLAESHQGWYFTTRSMTDDGRFLLFWTARNEFTHPGQEANRGPKGAACGTGLVDFATDTAIDLGIPRECHYLDVKTAQLWYIRRPDPRDPSRDAICRRDLAVDPMREIVECQIPPELIAGVTNIHRYTTHITLTQNRRKAFFTSWLDDRYVQGCVNFDTGRWEKWGETDFYANHDQICPTDDNVALIAWEDCWKTPDALAFRKRTGWYPRMWLCRPDGTHTLQPAYRKNFSSHECWATDGKGFYWCGGGVWYQDLETGAQTQVCPNPASHANLTTDNRFVCYDLGMEDRSVGHGNSLWFEVGFWNRTTQKGVLIHSDIPPMTPLGKSSVLHPHCHPAFGGADRYVIATRPCADGHFDLSVTPVAQLVEKTSAKGKDDAHD